MSDLLLGIDIGTTNVKAVLATPRGEVVASAQHAYDTHFPRQGWAEQNPADWWTGTVATTRQVLQQVDPQRVRGIGVSGQGCAVTLIDRAGDVIRPAIIWMDSRSEPQCQHMRDCCADHILKVNGKSPAPYNADPALMWLSIHEPSAIERAAVSLTTTAYINYRLTGETVANVSDASILFAFDLAESDWSDRLIAEFGLPRRLYPPVMACHEVIGGLTSTAADALGLPAGIPVVAGGEDTSSAGLALGVARPGQALLSLGTAGTVYAVQDEHIVHRDLLAFAHVIEGQLLLGGSMVAVGGAVQWLQGILGENISADAITALAGSAPPGAGNLLFLPYLSGELQPINDGNARGVFIGLSMRTSRAEMARAVLEGTAFAIAHNMALATDIGTPITEARAVGGPTKSALWCQLIADISGHPLKVLDGNAGAPLGDALLAARGVGLIDDLTQVDSGHPPRVYEPQPQHADRYAALFDVYKGLYARLASTFAAMMDIP